MEEKTIDYRELYTKEFMEKVELKKQLKNLEEDHEKLIDDFQEERENLCKQIKQQSEARKRAIARIRYFENKREQVEEIIDCTLAENLLNITDHEQYIKYIDKDLAELQDMKEKEEIDDNLFNHLVEELVLLQDIITIIKGEE